MGEVEDYRGWMKALMVGFNSLELDTKVEVLNAIREEIHQHSPFKTEPVDYIQWIKCESVGANDYNPNSVAPPEMKLLEHSITEDGYTQPIVSWGGEGSYEVVDGFHRTRVGRESKGVNERVHGYLPLVIINADREDRGDRIASTIRHNRARGKHKIDAMAEIVVELKRRNWSNVKVGRELGMDPDEVLRLTQITGLAEMFADREFSEAWEADMLEDGDFTGDQEDVD
jgi:ParB-like chromosome segregation protein Spo0J